MTRFLLPILLLMPSFVSAQNRFENHSGFSIGLEIGNYLPVSNTYPSKEPGYRFGYFTSIDAYLGTVDAVHLNFEFSYSSIASNRIGVSQTFNTNFPQSVYFTVSNEHFRLSFGELAIGPEYSRTIIGDLVFSLHASLFWGIGKESLNVYQVSQSIIVDTTISGYPYYMYGPYGEYSMAPIRFPYGLTIGFRLIWHSVILDGRFKQTKFYRSSSIMPIPKALFVSLGYQF